MSPRCCASPTVPRVSPRAVVPFKSDDQRPTRWRENCSLSSPPVAGSHTVRARPNADVPSHLQPAARLQMSWHGRHACWLWPCGHCSRRLQGEGRVWHRCLTIQRVAAELFAKAASELGIMVCRRVRRPSASPHRHRDRTRLWCKWDCMARRMRATGKPRVSNMGTFSTKPRTTRNTKIRLAPHASKV